MKKLIELKFMSILLVSVCVVSLAQAGETVRNGGDATAMEFTWMARVVIKRLESVKTLTPTQQDQVKALRKAIDETRVSSAHRLKLNGNQVDAINYPELKRIQLRRGGWAQMKRNTSTTRFGFVLHEYSGIAKIADTNYANSKSLLELLIDERASDESFQEGVLDSLLYLKDNLAKTYEIVNRTSRLDPENGARLVCLLAGRLQGYTSSLTLLITNPRPWYVGNDPDREIQILFQAKKEMEKICLTREIDVLAYRKQVLVSMRAVDGLSGMLLPKYDLTKPSK